MVELPAPAVVIRTPYGKTGELPAKRAAMFAAGGYGLVHRPGRLARR
jgi:hypothetical protein